MLSLFASPFVRLALLVGCCLLFAAPLYAAETGQAPLFAFMFRDYITTRSGMIQISIVTVMLGICVLIKR